jgi:hypothetical protein
VLYLLYGNSLLSLLAQGAPILTYNRDLAAVLSFLVGPANNPTKYFVDKELACTSSPAFKATFNGLGLKVRLRSTEWAKLLQGNSA